MAQRDYMVARDPALIASLIAATGMSKAKLAAQAGVSVATVSKAIAGKKIMMTKAHVIVHEINASERTAEKVTVEKLFEVTT